MAIDPDVARIILEAHMEGDRCPEAEEIIFKQKVTEDLRQVRATLTSVRADRVEWILEDGEEIYVTGGSSLTSVNEYDVLNPDMFRDWMRSTREILDQNGRHPHRLAMAGLLSLSRNAKLVVGWQEDYADDDSPLLAVFETMEE